MDKEKCPFCSTVIDKSATVCPGCWAQKTPEVHSVDTSTFGKVKGYGAAALLGLMVGYFSPAFGFLAFVLVAGLVAYHGGSNKTSGGHWVRR